MKGIKIIIIIIIKKGIIMVTQDCKNSTDPVTLKKCSSRRLARLRYIYIYKKKYIYIFLYSFLLI